MATKKHDGNFGYRTTLKKYADNQRHTFTATYMGTRPVRGSDENTTDHRNLRSLLVNVRDEKGKTVADHVWVFRSRGIHDADISLGDVIDFKASVKRYTKTIKDLWRVRDVICYTLDAIVSVEWIDVDVDLINARLDAALERVEEKLRDAENVNVGV